ncbi:MAG: GNAT family N-acetyltransferase [Bacteroidia bacterium]|nr:GNAT family N-acetyltransferase [Bacteroidia bacterium]
MTELSGLRIIQPKTDEELNAYYNLRYEVLVKPWNQPPARARDEWENNSVHFLMLNNSNEAIATGRLQLNSEVEGQIRSMAVSPAYQGNGLGRLIIKEIEKEANERKLKYIVLEARENALNFYLNCGYLAIADSFLLFDVIKHTRMRKDL